MWIIQFHECSIPLHDFTLSLLKTIESPVHEVPSLEEPQIAVIVNQHTKAKIRRQQTCIQNRFA